MHYIPNSLAMAGICVPNFVLGPLLVLIFALTLGWARVSGWEEPIDRVLPALTLGAAYAAYIARLTRGGLLEIFSQDFIRTARAKGASPLRIILKHALGGGLLPVVSYLGPAVAGLITGSFVVETIFQIPGLGRYFVNAAFNRDYTMVLGAVLFYGALIVVFNFIVDVAFVWMNPRLKLELALWWKFWANLLRTIRHSSKLSAALRSGGMRGIAWPKIKWPWPA
jgi:oligopeptide transport system permease protein